MLFITVKTITKLSLEYRRRGSRSPDNAQFWLFHVVVLQRTKTKCIKNYNARAKPLFCSLNLSFSDVPVAVAVPYRFGTFTHDSVTRNHDTVYQEDWALEGVSEMWRDKKSSLSTSGLINL